MMCRRRGNRYTICKLYRIIPFELSNNTLRKAPIYEMRADANRYNYSLDFFSKPFYSKVIEVIIMIMRNDKCINNRHITFIINVAALKRLNSTFKWTCKAAKT